jgi:hypothetical protein
MNKIEKQTLSWMLAGLLAAILVVTPFAIWDVRHPEVVHAQAPNGAQYLWIHTATTTVVRNGVGYLNAVTINGGTGGAVTLYDIASSGCTGTPASGQFATIASATAPVSLIYNISTKNGLCVVTAAATDVTVSYN